MAKKETPDQRYKRLKREFGLLTTQPERCLDPLDAMKFGTPKQQQNIAEKLRWFLYAATSMWARKSAAAKILWDLRARATVVKFYASLLIPDGPDVNSAVHWFRETGKEAYDCLSETSRVAVTQKLLELACCGKLDGIGHLCESWNLELIPTLKLVTQETRSMKCWSEMRPRSTDSSEWIRAIDECYEFTHKSENDSHITMTLLQLDGLQDEKASEAVAAIVEGNHAIWTQTYESARTVAKLLAAHSTNAIKCTALVCLQDLRLRMECTDLEYAELLFEMLPHSLNAFLEFLGQPHEGIDALEMLQNAMFQRLRRSESPATVNLYLELIGEPSRLPMQRRLRGAVCCLLVGGSVAESIADDLIANTKYDYILRRIPDGDFPRFILTQLGYDADKYIQEYSIRKRGISCAHWRKHIDWKCWEDPIGLLLRMLELCVLDYAAEDPKDNYPHASDHKPTLKTIFWMSRNKLRGKKIRQTTNRNASEVEGVRYQFAIGIEFEAFDCRFDTSFEVFYGQINARDLVLLANEALEYGGVAERYYELTTASTFHEHCYVFGDRAKLAELYELFGCPIVELNASAVDRHEANARLRQWNSKGRLI